MQATTSKATAVTLFAERGLAVVPAKGAPRGDEHLVSAEHDGVPYSHNLRDCFGKPDASKLDHALLHRHLTIERHHALVKAIYDHCANQGVGDIWAMCGGGCQLQVFFGNHTGYLAILYLDLEDLDEQERLSESGYLAAVGNETCTLVVNWARNNPLFRNFSHPRIKVRESS